MTQKLIMGVGGAGCYLANQIQSKVSCNSLAIDRAPHLLSDYNFSNKIEIAEQIFSGGIIDEDYMAALLLDIKNQLKGSSVLVLAIGLGGYIGTTLGVAIAKLANSMGVNVVCIVYLPFAFEGAKRRQVSLSALNELRACAAEVVVHDHNVEIASAEDPSQSLLDYFKAANESLMDDINVKLLAYSH